MGGGAAEDAAAAGLELVAMLTKMGGLADTELELDGGGGGGGVLDVEVEDDGGSGILDVDVDEGGGGGVEYGQKKACPDVVAVKNSRLCVYVPGG